MPSFQLASGSKVSTGEAEQVLRELLGEPRPKSMCDQICYDMLHEDTQTKQEHRAGGREHVSQGNG